MANTTIIITIIIMTIILVHVGELVACISGRGSRGITCNFFYAFWVYVVYGGKNTILVVRLLRYWYSIETGSDKTAYRYVEFRLKIY